MDIQPYNEQFQKVVNIIESAKERAYRKVNEELITMYRDIGEYISKQSKIVPMEMLLYRSWRISF
ncbi:MAG: hypothetical protein ACLT3Y_05390 [Ruminococcus callidus]